MTSFGGFLSYFAETSSEKWKTVWITNFCSVQYIICYITQQDLDFFSPLNSYIMEKVDLVLVGAEGVVESGGIINKVIGSEFMTSFCEL